MEIIFLISYKLIFLFIPICTFQLSGNSPVKPLLTEWDTLLATVSQWASSSSGLPTHPSTIGHSPASFHHPEVYQREKTSEKPDENEKTIFSIKGISNQFIKYQSKFTRSVQIGVLMMLQPCSVPFQTQNWSTGSPH